MSETPASETPVDDILVSEILGWSHPTAAIPANGLETRGQASAEQLQKLGEALGLIGVERLQARYKITQLSRGRFRLKGELKAKVVQACVVTLEPVPAEVVERFDVEFWPPEAVATAIPKPGAGDQSVLEGDEPERIEHNAIDAGRIVFETLAAALDPYPRAPGAELELPIISDESAAAANGQGDAANHPFAALAKLKREAD